MATLRDLLLNQAYNDLEFEPYPNKYIEIFKFEVRRGLNANRAAKTYLWSISMIGFNNDVQEWPESSPILSQNIMPFEESTLKNMVQTLGLPTEYLALFCHGKYTTPKFKIRHDGTRATLVYQSPNFGKSFTTLVLAYDPSTSITSGFLGYVYSPSTENLIQSLINTSVQVMHPLLLPMLCLNNWIYILRKETYAQDAQLREVQNLNGLMEDRAASDANKSQALSMGEDLYEAHATIVVMHNVLANSLVSFLQESSRDLKLALEEFKPMISADKQSILGDINEEFDGCLEQMDMIANGLIHMRERLLNRMDMQLKVLYNLMQQRDSKISQNIAEQSTKIAVASKRDSSAMKAIAVLTMLFLPGTAVASMFSMGSFFSAVDNSRVVVSSQFWLYWAIVLPLTGVVLTVWLSWLRLEKIRARREEDEQIESGAGWGSRYSLAGLVPRS